MQIFPSGLPDLVRVVPEISPPSFRWALMPVFVFPALTRIATTLVVGNSELMSGYHWSSQFPELPQPIV